MRPTSITPCIAACCLPVVQMSIRGIVVIMAIDQMQRPGDEKAAPASLDQPDHARLADVILHRLTRTRLLDPLLAALQDKRAKDGQRVAAEEAERLAAVEAERVANEEAERVVALEVGRVANEEAEWTGGPETVASVALLHNEMNEVARRVQRLEGSVSAMQTTMNGLSIEVKARRPGSIVASVTIAVPDPAGGRTKHSSEDIDDHVDFLQAAAHSLASSMPTRRAKRWGPANARLDNTAAKVSARLDARRAVLARVHRAAVLLSREGRRGG